MTTQSTTTILNYLNRARTHIARYEKKTGLTVSDSWEKYVEWLIELKPTISHATWRQYKAANVYLLQQKGMMDLANTLFDVDSDGVLKESDRTSAVKKKSISERQERIIREHLTKKVKEGQTWYKPLFAYFESILAVGFRPSEIPNSELLDACEEYDGPGPVLKVKNAKATNGRSFGEFRYIGCSELSDRQIILLKLALNYARECKAPTGEQLQYEKFYKALQTRCTRLITKLFPTQKKRITLYSCRHQCIADLKFAGYSLVEIAVIVGHGNDLTASEFYGKKRYGRSRGGLPLSNKKDLGKVKQLFPNKLQNRQKSINISNQSK